MANFRDTGSAIRLAQTILAQSYDILQTERLLTKQSPPSKLRTAWPAMVIEFSDLIGQKQSSGSSKSYSTNDIKLADVITSIYSDLPYNRLDKKITLIRSRKNTSWRDLAKLHGTTWQQCRSSCETVLLHLVCVASADPYKILALKTKALEQLRADLAKRSQNKVDPQGTNAPRATAP